jgi:hypothetical protein
MAQIDLELQSAEVIKKLALHQERINLDAELASLENSPDGAELELQFVAVAKAYGQRKGISYAAWRAVGVPAVVLKRAGITKGA